MSDKADEDIGAIDSGCSASYPHGLCCKSAKLFQHMHFTYPNSEWYARMVDDTYLFVDHSLELLTTFNPNKRVMLGVASMDVNCVSPATRCSLHSGGGAGWIFSRAVMHWLIMHMDVYLSTCGNPLNDDVHFGDLMLNAAHAHLVDPSGFVQNGGIMSALPALPNISLCPCPLPLAVFGAVPYKVLPFTPFEWTDLITNHAGTSGRVDFWPSVSALDDQLTANGTKLLCFLNSAKQNAFDLCVLTKNQQLDCFGMRT
jgi:hypothetical protein